MNSQDEFLVLLNYRDHFALTPGGCDIRRALIFTFHLKSAEGGT